MATNGFRFPPPPPPPPVRASSNDASHASPRLYPPRTDGQSGGRRMRGGGSHIHSNWNGSNTPRDQQLGQVVLSGLTKSCNTHSRNSSIYNPNLASASPQLKRHHGQAFNRAVRSHQESLVAPSVPQYGAPLPGLQVPDSAALVKPNKKNKTDAIHNRHNALGLTPAAADASSSGEDDLDEEAQYAEAINLKPQKIEKLVVTYKHKTFYLRNPEEIAAWISERRKHYPTGTRRADAEQRKRELAAAKEKLKLARAEARAKQSRGIDSKNESTTAAYVANDSQSMKQNTKAKRAQRKIEELQKRLEQQKRKLSKSQSQYEGKTSGKSGKDETKGLNEATPMSDASSEVSSTDSEDSTSSSGSSSSDYSSDSSSGKSLPENATMKATAPQRHSVPKQAHPKRICYQFKKQGRCKMGARCRYSHERGRQKSTASVKPESHGQKNGRDGRMTLYERLVKQEKEKEANKTQEQARQDGQD